jgi:hypothetical protein
LAAWLEPNEFAFFEREGQNGCAKHPAEDVAMRTLSALTDARLAANRIPLGGTFTIHVTVPGVASGEVLARS